MRREAWSLELPDGGRLSGTSFGDGTRVVLLLHGRNFDQTSWHDVAVELAGAGLSAVTLDFRGYGLSSALPSGTSHDADVVHAVRRLRAQGFEAICLLGGSMGGAAALRAATRLGSEVDRIAAVSPAVAAQEVAAILPPVPMLLIASRDEPYVDVVAYQELCPHPIAVQLFPGDAHNQALLRGPYGSEVRRQLLDFFG
jgi:alpha-beta hydrolase superfamily lysophospholipase